MKLYVQLMVLLFAFCKMTNVFADDTPGIYCLDTNTGVWVRFGAGVAMDRQVNIGTTRQYPGVGLQTNARAYPMSSIFLQCRNSMTDDAIYSMRIQTVYRSNNNYSPGLINGNYISYAYTGRTSFNPTNYEVITLPARNALRTLQIDPSLVLHATTTAIPTSGSLGVFEYVVLRNNVLTGLTMRINLIAQSETVFQPETCTVNNGLPINVELGTMSPSDIPVSTGSLQSGRSQEVPLSFSCDDKTASSRISVQLVGQQSSFSQTAVEARSGEVAGSGATIEHLGVEFYHEGVALRPNFKTGGFTTQITNGTGRETIVVAAVKSPDVFDMDLPAGYFNSTATLVLVLP